jgi:NTE family protein
VNRIERIVRSFRAFTRELSRTPQPTTSSEEFRRPTIGLALGGGFARGIAHIGALKVLEEEKIPIDFVAGTSVGSIIGAAFCNGTSAKELSEIAMLVRFKHFARWTFSRFGFCNNDRIEQVMKRMVNVRNFEDLKIPLAIAATEFQTGAPAVFTTGPIIPAVRASCAYPGMFLPVEVEGKTYVDGMLAWLVPTTPLKQLGADRVTGLYLNCNWTKVRAPRHLFDVIGQCFSIAQERMSGGWRRDADLVVEPNVDGFEYDCFDRAKDLMEAGEAAMRSQLPAIRSWQEAPQKGKLAEGKLSTLPVPGSQLRADTSAACGREMSCHTIL